MTLREFINRATNNDFEAGVLDSSATLEYEIQTKQMNNLDVDVQEIDDMFINHETKIIYLQILVEVVG